MSISRNEFAKLTIGDSVIFDAGNEEPVPGIVARTNRDGGIVIHWNDGGKSRPFYEEEVGTYIDWWLPRVHKHSRKPLRN